MFLRESIVLFFDTSNMYLAGKFIHAEIKPNQTQKQLVSMSLPVHHLVFNGFSSVQLETSSQELIPEEMCVYIIT